MGGKSKGRIEAEIGEALIKFEKEHMGRGPRETQTYIIRDMIIARMKGVLTPAEERLAKSEEGAALIKKIRDQLITGSRSLLEELVFTVTGRRLVSLHSDISTKTGERVVVFILDGDLEASFDNSGKT
ncbi:MAG: DUF2294 domain-containing protein [Spirochaetales bacterium]|nr:DUF2294 domain-containing protein [Spirochaetales bacterium]